MMNISEIITCLFEKKTLDNITVMNSPFLGNGREASNTFPQVNTFLTNTGTVSVLYILQNHLQYCMDLTHN